jgi:hypothetical protein
MLPLVLRYTISRAPAVIAVTPPIGTLIHRDLWNLAAYPRGHFSPFLSGQNRRGRSEGA